jgi:hypothetical protein
MLSRPNGELKPEDQADLVRMVNYARWLAKVHSPPVGTSEPPPRSWWRAFLARLWWWLRYG